MLKAVYIGGGKYTKIIRWRKLSNASMGRFHFFVFFWIFQVFFFLNQCTQFYSNKNKWIKYKKWVKSYDTLDEPSVICDQVKRCYPGPLNCNFCDGFISFGLPQTFTWPQWVVVLKKGDCWRRYPKKEAAPDTCQVKVVMTQPRSGTFRESLTEILTKSENSWFFIHFTLSREFKAQT